MSSMLDPDVRPSEAKEFVHKGKGCLAVIVAAAVLVFGGYFVYDRAGSVLSRFGDVPDYTGAGKANITVTIPKGASLDAIGSLLVKNDVVKSTRGWDAAVRSEERSTSIQSGRYIMRKQMAAIDALRLLINPGTSRVRLQFTIPEGMRLSAQVDALVKGTRIKKSSYQAALKDPRSLSLPGYAKNRPEGFLFPESYELTSQATARSTMKQMVNQYKLVTRQIGFEADAKKNKRSPYEALIVASIIEKEVNQDEYRAKVARVLYNRLNKGMNLSLDSTVIYAGHLKTNTTTPKDRTNPSKYNTYKHKGLPPGPISAPGQAALEAASNPEPGKWLYFTTVNFDTGETKFADNEADFLKIQNEFQTWCQAPGNQGKCDT